MEEINRMLEAEIKYCVNDLSSIDYNQAERAERIENLARLCKLRNENSKSELENDEIKLKQEQLAEQKKDRYFKLAIAAAEISIPLVFYAVWMKRGFKFEETGTYTSTTFKGLFSRFRPTKR